MIYERIPHPPRNLAHQDFRSADGADNLGAAGAHYAQSVIGSPKSKIAYPDSQELFNKLMLRTKEKKEDGTFVEKVCRSS